jgi:hypothetical protein
MFIAGLPTLPIFNGDHSMQYLTHLPTGAHSMEFYAVAEVDSSPIMIQRDISISKLAEHCASIDKVLSAEGDSGAIYCIWGEFKVHRELIRQGVRFTLPGCPNALQWTITSVTDGKKLVRVHLTIDRPEHDPDFVESLEQFVSDWKQGLEADIKHETDASRAVNDCLPVYG